MPDGWFVEVPRRMSSADREEIVVVGRLPRSLEASAARRRRSNPRNGPQTWPSWPVAPGSPVLREDTRELRMKIADEAEMLWDRKVSWGASCGAVDARCTSQSVAAMTRLRFDERAVLDTLIDAGVARSPSEALAWCVRLGGRHQGDWITQLREAMEQVAQVRSDGPDLDRRRRPGRPGCRPTARSVPRRPPRRRGRRPA